MMYHYWKTKGIRPSTFHNMKAGELVVIRAFYLKEVEEREEAMRAYQKNPMICPYFLFGNG